MTIKHICLSVSTFGNLIQITDTTEQFWSNAIFKVIFENMQVQNNSFGKSEI